MKKKLAEQNSSDLSSNVKSQTNNENHNYTVVMNCNYQSLEIEKCFAGGVEEKQSQKKNSYFTNNWTTVVQHLIG